ncbi:MAG: 30S ribosomal protein S6 [Planctomycetota bacterium]|nr:MAG: 30S ribosomal protein S6 [Planctomycetota bacterium]
MATEKKLYEAMFLVDSAEAAADWDGVNATIKKVLERAGAEIVSIRKWEDRWLAYEIGGKTRGLYVLSYFRAEGGGIGEIERDVQLSERIMRVLILSVEHLTEADIVKDTPAEAAEKRGRRPASEAVKGSRSEKAVAEDSDEAAGKPVSAALGSAESEPTETEDLEKVE